MDFLINDWVGVMVSGLMQMDMYHLKGSGMKYIKQLELQVLNFYDLDIVATHYKRFSSLKHCYKVIYVFLCVCFCFLTDIYGKFSN